MKGQLIAWGAESYLYLINYLNRKAILKERILKPYMDARLSRKLVRERTASEAKILQDCFEIGVNAPLPLDVDTDSGILIMTYIEGELLRDYLNLKGYSKDIEHLIRSVGIQVARMHNAGIVHGDLTTSNIIIKDKTPYIIDFGLSFKSKRSEDKAMDLRIFEKAIESTHPEYKESIFNVFLDEYYRNAEEAEKIRESLSDIKLRGRYIKERKESL